jgi:hypothetical protein
MRGWRGFRRFDTPTFRRSSSGMFASGVVDDWGAAGLVPKTASAVGGARILGEVAVLGGEPAVPCTRNPLQRG